MEISIKEATVNDIDEIVKLKKDIWNELENKEWYVIEGTDRDFLKRELENNGFILKAIDYNKVIEFFIICNSLTKESSIIKNRL